MERFAFIERHVREYIEDGENIKETYLEILENISGKYLAENIWRSPHAPRDGDRVEFGHLGRRVRENVRNDAHRRLRRVNVGVAHHVLLENEIQEESKRKGSVCARERWFQ